MWQEKNIAFAGGKDSTKTWAIKMAVRRNFT